MHKDQQESKNIGLNRREFDGKVCPFCGGHKYQLVLRWDMRLQADGLIARCAQCQRTRWRAQDIGLSLRK
jgi:hypothetical protein